MWGAAIFRRLRSAKVEQVSDRRRCMRTATIFQIAKLSAPDTEELCVLRDVSPTGLKAELYCPLPVGTRATFELKTGHILAGAVVWAEDSVVGVRFDSEVPVLAMLAHCAFDDRLAQMRPPRIDADLPGMLVADGVGQPIRALNLSLAGVKIALREPVDDHTRCTLALSGLEPLEGTLRWARGGEAGIQFDTPLDYATFAAWRRWQREHVRPVTEAAPTGEELAPASPAPAILPGPEWARHARLAHG